MAETLHLAFLLVPQFSMMAFSAAIEPVRTANRLSGKSLYDWHLVSLDGKPVTASNGIQIAVQTSLEDLSRPDMLIVNVGLDPFQCTGNPTLRSRLRLFSRQGCKIGGISGGTFVLADAGLLDERRCTVHWEYTELLQSRHVRIDVTSDLYVVDRNVFTCSGGTAAMDMMLHFIGEYSGADLALAVAEQFIHPRIRKHGDLQRMAVHKRYRIGNPKLAKAIRFMEDSLEEPHEITEIARQSGMTARQLERLFHRYVRATPQQFYLRLRLMRSRGLLQDTLRPVRDIALECGFHSSSHFCHAYRREFGHTPMHERRGAISTNKNQRFDASDQLDVGKTQQR